ncbi:hypothetical protein [Wolbachia endosymbiont of Oedothorax gibbosus]|uniref:hypothetical protein n=1 Tax=Wolbachia endosymbiont of Oedothorax gibbosus TaxID=931100 RepID=UPI0020248252|nr:hypothetical protein [Wolbachia endosymbiont of Oedothorax gibbosus]
MNTNDTQQEHIYNERLLEFFPLFDKKDDPIYNARVDFNTVKFLTERADWDWNEDKDKNKACGVILQEFDKIKKAEQKLESEVKKRLKDYIDDGVTAVSIYGNHASITLEDNKKEFKISEFLNSDFCEKNGISGFSTLHSDGKSGMHGFVAEEEGKKIRHYVVTDGSYEMTLKWYAKGEECKIKIKIDANGVELVKGDDFSLERLEANQDVKIGGLFLHEIEFREKGKVNEVQHNKDSNELSSETTTRIDVNRGVSVQATDITQKKEDHHSHFGLQSNSRRQSYDSGIGKDFDDKINSQEAEEKRELRQAARKANSGGQVYNLQSLFEENSQNKRTPPPPPLRTSSLPPEKDVFNEQGGSKLESQKPDRSEQTPNNQQKGATSDPSDSSTFTKSVSHNQDNRQEDERYDNPTFGHAVPESQKPDRSEQTPNNQQQPEIPQQEGKSKQEPKGGKLNYKEGESSSEPEANRKSELSSNTADVAQKRFLEDVLEKIKEDKPIYKWLKDKIEGKEDNQNLDALEGKLSKKYGQGNIVEKRENDDGKPLSTVSTEGNKESLIDVEQGSDTRSQKSSRRSGQEPEEERLNYQNAREALESWKEKWPKKYEINEDVKETSFNTPEKIQSELQKDNLADVKTVEGPTVSVSASRPNSISDSGYISPTHDNNEQSQVDPEQLKKCLENIKPKEIGDTSELKEALEKLDKGLREPAQQATKENIPKGSFSESVLEKIKEGKQYDPIRELLKNKIGSQDNIITAATELGTVLSELCTEAQKGFAKREEEKRFAAKDEQKTRD